MTPSKDSRPTPGPRAEDRRYWDGYEEKVIVGGSRRMVGVDAARGFALFGMFAVHLLPMVDETRNETYTSHLFNGQAAPLFGLLAGVTLALLTGGIKPHTGRRLTRSRVGMATRAALLMVVGLLLNLAPLMTYNILPYYAVYLLLGLGFVGMRVRSLLVWSGLFAFVGPLVLYFGGDYFFFIDSPGPIEAITNPVTFLFTLVFSGTYPAITWMAYIVLGIAIGRLDLRDLTVQIRLCVTGALAGFGTLLAADAVMHTFNGVERLISASDSDQPVQAVLRILHYEGTVPSTTPWWLLTNVAHGNSVVSVASTAGIAVFTLGGFLLAARGVERMLTPLAKAGSMTLTLYSAHLVLMAYVDVWSMAVLWLVIFIGFSVFFAVGWLTFLPSGPLEAPVSAISKAVGRWLVKNVEPGPPGSQGPPGAIPVATERARQRKRG